jgi:hypothetical protein
MFLIILPAKRDTHEESPFAAKMGGQQQVSSGRESRTTFPPDILGRAVRSNLHSPPPFADPVASQHARGLMIAAPFPLNGDTNRRGGAAQTGLQQDRRRGERGVSGERSDEDEREALRPHG